MFGFPSKAQNMIVMRPFSRRWATVSTPLPVRSRYATVFGSRIGERVQALGRQVHVTAIARCGGDEEHALGGDERDEIVGDRVEDPPHQVRTRGNGIAEEPNGGSSSNG